MTSRRPRRASDASVPGATPCPPASDLTAFAIGCLPDARRAAISRHLLQCPRCRANHESSSDVLGRLRHFGAAATWEGEVEAASLAHSARVSARRRGAMAGIGTAAALALGLFALPAGTTQPSAGRPPAAATTTSRVEDAVALEALLRAQDVDGHWTARDGASGHDDAATGLAVLALVTDRPEALRAGPVGQAVGRATRWLSTRTPIDSDGRPGAAGARDQALVTAALLEVYAATRDASLRPAVDRAVRVLSRRATQPEAEAFSARTLARAEALGWRRHGPSDAAVATGEDDTPWPLRASSGSLCAQALAVLSTGTRE